MPGISFIATKKSQNCDKEKFAVKKNSDGHERGFNV